MITSGKLYLCKDMQSIAVTYSRFLGYIKIGRLLLSALVTTLAIEITPI